MATNNGWNNNIAGNLYETGFIASSISSGGTFGVSLGEHLISLTGSGTIASYTINLPTVTSVNNGYRVLVSSTVTITSLTIVPDGTHNIFGAPTTLPAGCSFEMFYNGFTSSWMPYSQYILPNTLPSGLIIPNPTIIGQTSGSTVGSGYVGHIVKSVKSSGSAVSLTANVVADVTSMPLAAGDWDLWGNVSFIAGTSATCTFLGGWISTTSATLPDSSLYASVAQSFAFTAAYGFCVPGITLTLSSPATVYLSVDTNFSVSTLAVCGGIYARIRD